MSVGRTNHLLLIIIFLINDVQCSESNYNSVSVVAHQKSNGDNARFLGFLVGTIVQNIDWLPFEINVIDVITAMVRVFSGWFASATSTLTTMA